jgi:hypothetical protein
VGVAVGSGVSVDGMGVDVYVAVDGMGVPVGVALLMGVSVDSGVAVGGTSATVGSAVGDKVAHPARTVSAAISKVHRSRGFTSISLINGLLFGLHFKRADVAWCVG